MSDEAVTREQLLAALEEGNVTVWTKGETSPATWTSRPRSI